MKYIFLLFFLILNNADAAELKCSNFYSESVSGVSTLDGAIVLSVSPPAFTQALQTTMTTKFELNSLKPAMIQALSGNHIIYRTDYPMFGKPVIDQVQHGGQITQSTPQNIQYTWYLDNSNDYRTTHYVLLSGSPTEASPPVINEVITGESVLSAHGFSVVSYSNGRQQFVEANLNLSSALKTTDSINIPSIIDIENLSVGTNNSKTSIDYSLNTNSIPIFFTNSTTPSGAQLMLNNSSPVLSIKGYTPPFRFGMHVLPNAQPGIYTSTVNATWTCP
ncbi:hypothetical protein OGV52_20810 [Citrobacter sp. Cb041]|jgi:hypothetical protein|uniref:hypothetical protein n=1 Tax=Citrobacter TaxID=544 RepID=UPI0019062D06|nr:MULTISPECIES: hypothetical protein [Citrobacter]MBJ9571963.1 hypothetical protein [Citrobacter braakii]MDM3470083.1 hypothetical protein [Citrobacter sp. Cb041]